MTTTTTPDVPLPDGAVRVYQWDPPAVTGYPCGSRYFVCTSRRITVDEPGTASTGGAFEVSIDGTQWSDGRIDRCISMNDSELSPSQARQLAAALSAAADEVDGWAGR
jgi:hypothetical protein